MSDPYALRFLPHAQRQIERTVVSSRLRGWWEETVADLCRDLKTAPLDLGEGREDDALRLLVTESFSVLFFVNVTERLVTVLEFRPTA